jgi:hypothetical protein
VPAGKENMALAAPEATVPEVTGVPIVVPPWETVKVTAPELTVPERLVTVADRDRPTEEVLKVVVRLAAVVVVAAGVTVKVCVLSLLAVKPPPPL